MDNTYLYFAIGAIVAGVAIFLNKRRQKTTVADFVSEAQASKPMFMQQAVEKKLRTLKTTLFINKETSAVQANPAAEAKKQMLIAKLGELEKSYADGALTLKAYDNALHELVMQLPR